MDNLVTFGKILLMKFLFSFVLFSFNVGFLASQTATELSISLIGKLQRAQYDSCQTMFDTVVSNKINADMMKQIWENMPKYIGEYQSYGEISTAKEDSTEIVTVTCAFVKTKMDLRLAYNKQQKIIGIFFLPPKNKLAYNAPEYSKPHQFYESKVTLKTGKYELPAVLCIPNTVKNPPVVILLAGSGPNDKDETIGPNKLLKDIASGLASNGIASIRYDKRTLVYGKELVGKPDLGINEEVIEDAISAVNMIRKNPLFKDSKIYIIGHSLGAMCAPLVASKAKVNGIVMMAANARPLEDLIVEQYEYLAGTEKSEETDQIITNMKKKALVVKDPKALKSATPDQLPLNLPSFYWQSLTAYKQVDVAKKLKQPILVLQGERDYQVTMTDFNLWKSNLSANPKNTFISYPALNHLFMKGEGKSMPLEYEKQGSVEEKTVVDIAEWIKAH
jgi:dienelactone hydrolase